MRVFPAGRRLYAALVVGLVVVAGAILDAHGGAISLVSRLGRGTTATVSLPVAPA